MGWDGIALDSPASRGNRRKKLVKMMNTLFLDKKNGKFGYFFAIRHFPAPKFYYGLLLNELLLQLIITNLKCNFIIVKLSKSTHSTYS